MGASGLRYARGQGRGCGGKTIFTIREGSGRPTAESQESAETAGANEEAPVQSKFAAFLTVVVSGTSFFKSSYLHTFHRD
jgi:hypothetical protein